MPKIKDLIDYLEGIAPTAYQENYDNSGLLVGNPQSEITGVLISLDTTEKVVEEALKTGCNLIISHHPIVFKGLKRLTGANYVERTVLMAIRHDIALYAIHTNLDNVHVGVNKKICDKLGLTSTQILAPKPNQLRKLTTFIPRENTDAVMDAIYQTGAGQIGDYSHCSFRVSGTGTFLPNEHANPHIGARGELEKVEEDRVELIFPAHLHHKVIGALKMAHPYEQVAYYLYDLANENKEVGAGMVGQLPTPMKGDAFIAYLKEKMGLQIVKHTALPELPVEKVAVCGGAGSFLLRDAIRAGAQAFVSSDFKYHEFFDAEGKIMIADIGHYESEVFTKDLIYEILYKKFPNIALHFSKVITNPVLYS